MNLRSTSKGTSPRLLSHALLRAHVISILVAVCCVGTALTIAGLVQLHGTVTRNLELVARAMAFSAEAAVVFHDAPATEMEIERIAATEDVENVVVTDEHKQVLASWSKKRLDGSHVPHWLLNRGLLNETVRLPVFSNGRLVGAIQVKDSPDTMWGFLVTGCMWILVCVAASLLLTVYLTRRTFRLIMDPLHALTEVTRRVRTIRSFGERVPQSGIVELNDLANDFNSLLGELDRWEAGVQGENRALAHRAAHDGLTGLPNRMAFEDRLEQAMQRAQADSRCFAVLFIDSDDFKSINDRFGHAAGDAVLVEVAGRISAQLRAGDIVARLGGDEFVVLLDPVKDREGAERVAAAIIAAMTEPVALEAGPTIVTSVSVGTAIYPHDAAEVAGLLRHADSAMYVHKTSRLGAVAPVPDTEEDSRLDDVNDGSKENA